MTIQIKVPYFSYADLSKISYQFLQKFNFATKIPVPIEEIIDLKLKINIFASPGLRDIHEIEGWTSGDLSTIFVDEFIFYHRETRFRFTLAHELGHIVLHKKIYGEHTFSSIEDWKRFCNKIDKKSYSWVESQAYNFAGLILVPSIHLTKFFKDQIIKHKSSFDSARFKKLTKDKYQDYFIDVASVALASIFNVSTDVISRRIEKDGLIKLIP